MITKGIIKSIDFKTNTCIVRIPLYEANTNEEEILIKATFSIQPGVYNGYKEDDVVYIDFEQDLIDSPIILGKLFLGGAKEAADPRSAGNFTSLNVSENATLPLDTKLKFTGDTSTHAAVDKGITDYKSLKDIINAIQVQNQETLEQNNEIKNKLSANQDGSITGFGWQIDDKAWRIQSYDDSRQIPIIDILRVDNSGLTVAGNIKIVGYPSKIETKYLQTTSPTDTPAENNIGWSETVPPWENGKYIWQKTVTYTYEYNASTQLLDEKKTIKIVCITGAAGASGDAAVSYWLNVSTPVHTGACQQEDIVITAMTKVGSLPETTDGTATIVYKWGSNGQEIAVSGGTTTISTFRDEDLIIEAKHGNIVDGYTIFDSETVTFSPLNTPILDLDNDSASIAYNGIDKIDVNATITSTASLYLNGSKLTTGVSYSWSLTNCVKKVGTPDNTDTIEIAGLSTNDAIAICEAEITDQNSPFYGNTYSKVLTITKQQKGERGQDGAAGASAITYWLDVSAPVHTGINRTADLIIIPKQKAGDSPEDYDTGTALVSTIIKYRWESDVDTDLNWHTLTANANHEYIIDLFTKRDDNIVIKGIHHNNSANTDFVFDTETITFSPVDTPVLDLTNDSASLAYYGNAKIGTNLADSTATLYLNGVAFTGTVSYEWTLTHCKTSTHTTTVSGQAVAVSTIDDGEETGTATCIATYTYGGRNNNTATKVFTITKQQRGDAATICHLEVSMPVHTGDKRTSDIEIKVWKKAGTGVETLDDTPNTTISYRWKDQEPSDPTDTAAEAASWTVVNGNTLIIGQINPLTNERDYTNLLRNEDLQIRCSHGNTIFDSETITYSPLNTPIIDLSNDTAAIAYDINGNKLNNSDTVSSTGRVYLNGTLVNGVTFSWRLIDCADPNSLTTVSGATVTIDTLSENTARAECNATNIPGYPDLTLTKDFTITKQVRGAQGLNSGSYWLVVSDDVHRGILQSSNITITAYKQIGEDGDIEPDDNARLFINGTEISDAIKYTKVLTASYIQSTFATSNIEITVKHYDSSAEVGHEYSDVYDYETIEYSPKTPIIALTNDSGQIKVDKNGSRTNTTTTAKLYVDGSYISNPDLVTFNWTIPANTTATTPSSSPVPAIPKERLLVTNINNNGSGANNAVFTCTASYGGNTYTKDFTVVKLIDGADGSNGSPGQDATSYWLNTSMQVHTGTNRTADIEITAWKKTGESAEEFDSDATIEYKWESDSDWTELEMGREDDLDSSNPSQVYIIPATETANEDLLIHGLHGSLEFDTETITFSPLNTPVLDLTNDSASLPYTKDGNIIGNPAPTVDTTANLYLGGELITSNITYTWTLSGIPNDSSGRSYESIPAGSGLNNKLIVKQLTNNTATATCTATYIFSGSTKTYSKVFTIVKQLQGEDGQPGNPGKGVSQVKTWYILASSQPTTPASEAAATAAGWSTQAPAPVDGYDYWLTTETCFTDSSAPVFTTPTKDSAYALAQGKTTNYYDDQDPAGNSTTDGNNYGTANSSRGFAIKDGDCWFDTGFHRYPDSSNIPQTRGEYLGKWAEINGVKQQVTPENVNTLNGLTPGTTLCYEKGTLKQWSATDNEWVDISGELVTNKLTANYINAMDIRAKKIEIKDGSNNTLLLADGISNTHTVKIGNFDVGAQKVSGVTTSWITSGMTSRDDTSHTGVYVGTDGISVGGGAFKVTSGGVLTLSGYATTGNGSAATDVTTIAGGWLQTTNITAQNLVVNNVLVKDSDADGAEVIFSANSSTHKVTAGGFDITADTFNYGIFGQDASIWIAPEGKNGTISTLDSEAKDWTLSIGENFGVAADGTLYAKNAQFLTGKIGLLTVSENKLSYSGFTLDPTATAIGAYGGVANIMASSSNIDTMKTGWATPQSYTYYWNVFAREGMIPMTNNGKNYGYSCGFIPTRTYNSILQCYCYDGHSEGSLYTYGNTGYFKGNPYLFACIIEAVPKDAWTNAYPIQIPGGQEYTGIHVVSAIAAFCDTNGESDGNATIKLCYNNGNTDGVNSSGGCTHFKVYNNTGSAKNISVMILAVPYGPVPVKAVAENGQPYSGNY